MPDRTKVAVDSRFWQCTVNAFFAGFPGEGHQMTVGWLKMAIFSDFGQYIFGTFRDKVKIITH